MSTPYYFGFGSLVNERTLPPTAQWQKATLSGWRRIWRHPVPGDPGWAAMDVVADANCSIDGLLIAGSDIMDSYLIQRESGYHRNALSHDQLRTSGELPADAKPCLWTSKSAQDNDDEQLWLMQSYVDVVMAGYLRHFGVDGLERFVGTTGNWKLPIFDDRMQPRYPRSVSLNEEEIGIIAALQPNP